MSKRLEVLKRSLEKKQTKLDSSFDLHFSTVKQANGQPLNDKKDGHKTLAKWERQNETIRRNQFELEKTQSAIEREEGKIKECNSAMSNMPVPIVKLVDDEILKQWRKHPTIFFVKGVDKARIQYRKGVLSHRYVSSISDKDQYAIFRDTFNNLRKELENDPSPIQI